MSEHSDFPQAAQVLETDGALSTSYYSASKSNDDDAAARSAARPEGAKAEKPTHYKVICISMYTKDLDHLDNMVESLKAKGMTKANRSALIRYALGEVNLDQVPQGL